MNQSLQNVLAKTVIAMIGANPRGYLSTQLELIQQNLSVWEDIDVSLKTVSRSLHNLAEAAIINLKVVPVPKTGGQWHGRKLIITATERLWAYARSTYRILLKFLHLTERTKVSVEPTLTSKVLTNDYPHFTDYILSDVPYWVRDPQQKASKAFFEAVRRL